MRYVLKYFIKKVVLTCFFCNLFIFGRSFKLFSEDFARFSISELFALPKIRLAQLDYKISLLESKSIARPFLPFFSFSSDFLSSGNFIFQALDFSYNPCVNIYQHLPGGLVFQSSFSVPFYFSQDFFTGANELFSANIESSFSLRIPICFSKNCLSDFNLLLKDFYDLHLTYAKNCLDISQLSEIADFFYRISLFLVYKRMKTSLEDKLFLTQQLCKDYEESLKLGKISIVSYMQVSENHLSVNKELAEVKLLLIQNETLLKSKKVDLNELEKKFNINDFIGLWENSISLFENSSLSEKNELLLLKRNYFSLLKSAKSEMPSLFLETSFSYPSLENGFSVKNISWKASLYFNLNIFPDANLFDCKKKLDIARLSYKISEEQLELKKINKKKERVLLKENSAAYCENMKSAFNLENERAKSFESLFSLGRLSKLDLDFQKNSANLAELYYLKARIEHLNLISSLY